jgi:hypothetical protein
MEHREKVKDVLSCDVLWPLKVLTELLIDVTTSRSHVVFLFDLRAELFQFETPPTVGVTREVWEMININ